MSLGVSLSPSEREYGTPPCSPRGCEGFTLGRSGTVSFRFSSRSGLCSFSSTPPLSWKHTSESFYAYLYATGTEDSETLIGFVPVRGTIETDGSHFP